MDSFNKFISDTWLKLAVGIALIVAWIFKSTKARFEQELEQTISKKDLESFEEKIILKIENGIIKGLSGLDSRLSGIEAALKYKNTQNAQKDD
jgi:hypothetical protein